MRDCPRTRGGGAHGQHVKVYDFPRAWQDLAPEKVVQQIAAELEVFGALSASPVISDDGRQAIAAFSDPELARAAVEALNGAEFRLELCEAPGTAPADCCVLIKGFSSRWATAWHSQTQFGGRHRDVDDGG